MKFKIGNTYYSEVGQPLPMRWALVYREADGVTHTGQHSWWKCKDFLNDVVIYLRTGKKFSIYSFDNVAKLNDDGGYMALKNVPEFFEHNLAVLNEWLLDRGFTPLEYQKVNSDGVECLVLIPTEYWQNTLYISVITSLIRSCAYTKGDSVNTYAQKEQTIADYWDRVQTLFVPENSERFNELLFVNYNYDGDNPPEDYATYIYHNAGLQSWIKSRYATLKETETC